MVQREGNLGSNGNCAQDQRNDDHPSPINVSHPETMSHARLTGNGRSCANKTRVHAEWPRGDRL